MGRLTGPTVGAALLTDRNPDNTYEDDDGHWRQPMLVPAVGKALAGLTRGPRWSAPEEPFEGEFTPLHPQRMGKFTPVALPSGEPTPAQPNAPTTAAQLETAAQRSDYIDQETDEEMEQHITDVTRSAAPTAKAETSRADASAGKLEQVADRLMQAAERLMRAAEGRLQVSGSANVASTMGDTVALLAARGTANPDNFAVTQAMAGALGVTPIRDGKPPIENDLARFGLFTNQALTMGLNPEQTERVVREVKESPEGKITDKTRDELIQQGQGTRGISWADAEREVDTLEHAARVLPNDISAYGLVNVPAAAPNVQVAPDIEVRPTVQVTVEAGNDTPESGVQRGDDRRVKRR